MTSLSGDGVTRYANLGVGSRDGGGNIILPGNADQGLKVGDPAGWGWRDMTADLTRVGGGGNNPPTWANFRDGIDAWRFGAGVLDMVWVTFHPNHDVVEGAPCYPHIHWAPNTTSTGVVRWGVEYIIAKGHDQEAFPASTTIYFEPEITVNKQYQHIITECSDAQAFPMPEVDSLIMMRVFRDGAHANDTFPDGVFGLTADLHYQSTNMATVNKAPNFYGA